MSRFELAASQRITASIRGDDGELEIEGAPVRLTNLDRVLYPQTGFTKRDLIDYYAAVSPLILPHLADRPVTMRRFPDGVEGEGFWEKHCPEHRPEWVRTALVESSSSKKGQVEFCLVNDLPTLIWMANLASIELHVSLAKAEQRDSPDFMVFDLDPGAPAALLDCGEVALLIRGTLEAQGIASLAKVSGSKGIQVYVPLNSGAQYENTGDFAHSLARAFEQELPELVVSKMKKSLRKGKILIDWSQNSRHKTTVAVFSMRAKDEPSVSAPVSWDEIELAVESNDPTPLQFGPKRVLDELLHTKDPFAAVLNSSQDLT